MTSIAPPICYGCKHLVPTSEFELKCTAFPQGIPNEIVLSKHDHRTPFPGDHGVRFEAKTPEDAEYAANMFDRVPAAE